MRKGKVNEQVKGRNARKERAVREQAISLNCLFSTGEAAEIGLVRQFIHKGRF